MTKLQIPPGGHRGSLLLSLASKVVGVTGLFFVFDLRTDEFNNEAFWMCAAAATVCAWVSIDSDRQLASRNLS